MIILPTRQRPQNLKNFFESYHKTNATIPGILLIDQKDFMKFHGAYMELKMHSMPENWLIYLTETESMGDKVREAWHLYKDCDAVGILNDDHYMITDRWDEKLLARLNGKNFVSCNDNWNAKDGKAAGLTLWSGELLRAVGYIFPPRLQHCFIDDIWEFLGRTANCWTVDWDVIIEHRHVAKGEAPEDETHKRMQKFFYTDGPIYLEWQRYEAGLALARIRGLQH